MADMFFVAGQLLGVIGLAYGWFLTLTYRDQAAEGRAQCGGTSRPHHLAMT